MSEHPVVQESKIVLKEKKRGGAMLKEQRNQLERVSNGQT